MNPRVIAWMAATGEKTLDGTGHRYSAWITGKWAEWKRLQGRRLESPILESDHTAFDAWLTRKDLLAAYEDTDMTPDGVSALRDENERLCAALKLAQTRAADMETEFKHLVDANKTMEAEVDAGRLVRYPCRPGDTVWTIWRDVPEMTVHSEFVAAILDTGSGPVPCKDYGFDNFGAIFGCFDSPQPYYLTQDEAEAARAALGRGMSNG